MVQAHGRLEGKVAVVTGAASGIGAGCADAMAVNGAAVVVADIALDAAEEHAAQIRGRGGRAVAVAFDAAQGDAAYAALFELAVTTFGGLDVVMNNAIGMRPPTTSTAGRSVHRIEAIDEAWFDAFLHGTATATMLGIKHAVAHLRARGGGSIINTASISGLRGESYLPGYGAGKAAVVQLTRAAASMYGREGIRCNAICPGLILSPAGQKAFGPEVLASFQRHTPMNRLGTPDDVGHLAVYLASDESRYMTGQALVLDGGFTMHEPTWADRLDLDAEESRS